MYLRYLCEAWDFGHKWGDKVQKLTKATIIHDIFSVKSLTFVPFRLIAMYFLHEIFLFAIVPFRL